MKLSDISKSTENINNFDFYISVSMTTISSHSDGFVNKVRIRIPYTKDHILYGHSFEFYITYEFSGYNDVSKFLHEYFNTDEKISQLMILKPADKYKNLELNQFTEILKKFPADFKYYHE